MASGLEIETLLVGQVKVAEHIGIQEAAPPPSILPGIAGEPVVGSFLAHRCWGVIIILAMIDIIIKSTATQHRTIIVFLPDQFTQRRESVTGQAVTLEVTVAIIGIGIAEQLGVLPAHTYTQPVGGNHRPIQGRAITETDRFTGRGRRGHRTSNSQRQGTRHHSQYVTVTVVILVSHTVSAI